MRCQRRLRDVHGDVWVIRRNDLHPCRSRSRRNALDHPLRRHHDTDTSLDQERHRHVRSRRVSVISPCESAAEHGSRYQRAGQYGRCASAAIGRRTSLRAAGLFLRRSYFRTAPHPILIRDCDGNTVGPQAISDRRGEWTRSLDALWAVDHNRHRHRHLRQNRFRVSTRHHLHVASRRRHDQELRRDLHYRQRSIRLSVAKHLCPSQHHNVVRHRARSIAHTLHARRRPPRRTNDHDRFGRTADDVVHDGSPHVRDLDRTVIDQDQLVINAVDAGRNPLRVRMVGASDCCRAHFDDNPRHGGSVQATWTS